MLSLSERPRELRWYHAAGLLFGDWGTSRLYVLGIAFVLTGHASFWYVAAMSILVTLVGLAYTCVCKHFPDGGGVYSVARQVSPALGVIGALLLVADYLITAALSAYEGFRYILPEHVDSRVALYCAVVSILLIGVLNYFGLRRAGVMALIVTIFSVLFYLIVGGACTPGLAHPVIEHPEGSAKEIWGNFVNVILALSGVEAIANMTGVMAEPVAKNARRAIFVVLLEVVVLNLVMGWAMNSLQEYKHQSLREFNPAEWTEEELKKLPEEEREEKLKLREDLQDRMVKILAEEYVGKSFAAVASIFFGMLLLSAANTAIGGMVSIQYLMGRDRELPAPFTRLNRHGVPWLGLVLATGAAAVILLIVGNDTQMLASLYAIGVVGAITINLGALTCNRDVGVVRWERFFLGGCTILVGMIWITIAIDKPLAALFAGVVVGSGLLARIGVKKAQETLAAMAVARAKAETLEALSPSQSRLLVATRGGNPELLKFAVGYAKNRNAVLFVLFVREVSLSFRERGQSLGTEELTLEHDKAAQGVFDGVKKMGAEQDVHIVPLYAVHDSPAELILDHAATLGADTVLMGISRRSLIMRAFHGDVIHEVVAAMPKEITVLLHA